MNVAASVIPEGPVFARMAPTSRRLPGVDRSPIHREEQPCTFHGFLFPGLPAGLGSRRHGRFVPLSGATHREVTGGTERLTG